MWHLFNAPEAPYAPFKTQPKSAETMDPEAAFEEKILIPSKYQKPLLKGEGEPTHASLVGDAEMSELEKTVLHKVSYPPLFQEQVPLKKPAVFKVGYQRIFLLKISTIGRAFTFFFFFLT